MGNGIMQGPHPEPALARASVRPDQAAGQERAGAVRAAALALLGTFLFCYAGVLASLADQWWNNNIYSYGFLVPLISIYIVWERRAAIFSGAFSPAYFSGGGLLLAGLFLFAFGHAGGIITLQQVSFMVTLMGVVLLFLGVETFRRLALPIHYLWLMIPIWDALTGRLHLPFQILSANLGVLLLQQVGVPVYQDYLYIHLPNITLEVAEVCSGVNYLIAVIALGIPLGYLFLHRWVTRVGLIVFGVVVAALSNSLRVGLIGVLAYYDLSGDLHGPYHTLQGIFVSVIGYGALFLGLGLLIRWQAPQHAAPSTDGASCLDVSAGRRRVLPVCAVFLLVGGYGYFFAPAPVPLARDLAALPMQIGEWRGRDMTPEAGYKALGADRLLARRYRHPAGEAIDLHIAYFESQAQGRELAGQATRRLDAGAMPITLRAESGAAVEALNQSIQGTKGERRLTLFWYDLGGKILLDRKEVKLRTAWNALVHGVAPGALIAVSSRISNAYPQDRVFSAGKAFIAHLRPFLPAHFYPSQEPARHTLLQTPTQR